MSGNIGISESQQSAREDLSKGTGGGRGTGIQRSLNLECPEAHMGVRLGSKAPIENIARIQPEKECQF